MNLTPAEQQLIQIIRAARGYDLTVTIRVRGKRYAVRVDTHHGPAEGIGIGDSLDDAWNDITVVTELRAQHAG